MFELKEIELHGRKKWQIVFKSGGKHLAYFNDLTEAQNVLRHLNSK